MSDSPILPNLEDVAVASQCRQTCMRLENAARRLRRQEPVVMQALNGDRPNDDARALLQSFSARRSDGHAESGAMNPYLTQRLMLLARPLRALNVRVAALERLIDGRVLDAQEAASIMDACHSADLPLGAFYYWKLEQMALIASLRGLKKEQALALARCKDGTDYTIIEACLDDPRGLLLAMPHHGHFVLSIMAMSEYVRHKRDVFILRDPPEAHATHKTSGAIYERLFGDEARITILHNDRAGIARTIKELSAGHVAIIMPDVYTRVDDTYQVPFCGGLRNAMLDTATIARRTGARILPLVSQPGSSPFEFATTFGQIIGPPISRRTPESDTYADFRTTMALFQQLESLMADRLLFWQYVRDHVASRQPGSPLTPGAIQTAGASRPTAIGQVIRPKTSTSAAY